MARHPQRPLIRAALTVVTASLAAGCAAGYPTGRQDPPAPPVTVEEASIPAPERAPPPEPAGVQPAAPPAATPSNPQVPTLALLQQSQRSADSGDLDSAMAYVERAIRLSPRDPSLWLQLARLQLGANQPGRAEQTAQKALSLAGRQREIERDSWLVIAAAREAQGDHDGASRIRAEWRTYRG